MEEIDFVASFRGESASDHRLPAYEGFQSLTGIARAFVLISHYLAEGKIKKRMPYTHNVQYYIQPPRSGSFEAVITAIIEAPVPVQIGGVLLFNLTTSTLYDIIKTIFPRTVGLDAKPNTKSVQRLEEDRSGDMEALVDAVEPAISLAYTSINSGANSIILFGNNDKIVKLNEATREYVRTSKLDENDELLTVSIGSYNVNSRYGRAYMPGTGKTVPFIVSDNADTATIRNISSNLLSYALQQNRYLQITARRLRSADGRTKKLVISRARPED